MKRLIAISVLAVAAIAFSKAQAEASTETFYLECKGITSRPELSDEVTVNVKRYKIDLAKKRVSILISGNEEEIDADAVAKDEIIEVRFVSTFENQTIHSNVSFDRYAGVVRDQSISSGLGVVTFTGECSRVEGPPVRQF